MIGTIHERIERLVKEFGGGKNTVFADKIGVSEGNIRGYIKGIMPKYDVLEKIVTSLDVNPDWLLTGRGNMEKEPDLQQAGIQVQEKFPLKTDNLLDLQRIPLYNLEATAGLVSLFNDVDAIPISYISLPDLLHAMGLFMCAGIRCTHYSKAAILSFTSRYTTCSTGFSGVKCTLYRPMSMGTSS